MLDWIYNWIHTEHYTVAFFWKTYDLKKVVYNYIYGAGKFTKVDETSSYMCKLV
jgi:hypothetical protein